MHRRAWEGPCSDKLPWVLCRDRDFGVAIASWAIRAFGSQHSFGVAIRGAELMGWFCVVTVGRGQARQNFAMFFVAIEKSLS